MKRCLVILAVLGLVVLAASPAKAAPSELGVCEPSPLLGIELCVRIDGNEAITTIVDGTGDIIETVVAPVQTVVERVEVPVIIPGPTPSPVTVTPPRATVTQAPMTVTERVTVTEEGPTVTETISPPTVTVSPSSPENTPGGQDRDDSDRVGNDSAPTLASQPPGEPTGGIDLIPDSPKAAAVTFSLLGLFVGIMLGVVGLIVAYKRGKTDGEQATMDQFLGDLQGTTVNTGPKHRA